MQFCYCNKIEEQMHFTTYCLLYRGDGGMRLCPKELKSYLIISYLIPVCTGAEEVMFDLKPCFARRCHTYNKNKNIKSPKCHTENFRLRQCS